MGPNQNQLPDGGRNRGQGQGSPGIELRVGAKSAEYVGAKSAEYVGALFVEERKQKILEHIAAHRKATVVELCDLFRVSSATIRNDLRDLEATGLLVRTHGGAMIKSKTGHAPDMVA